MWPWRKSDPEAPAPPPVTHHDDVVRPTRSDWQQLAPIQRAIGEPPLVNPVQRFSDSLATWQDPSFLAPLAHIVHADEPSGLIPEIATAVPQPVPLPLAVPTAPQSPKPRPGTLQRVVAGVASAPQVAEPERTAVVDSPATSPAMASAPLVRPRSLPVQRSASVDSGPLGRIEMPPGVTLAALPSDTPAQISAAPADAESGAQVAELIGHAHAAPADPETSTMDGSGGFTDALPLAPGDAGATTTPTLHTGITVARVVDPGTAPPDTAFASNSPADSPRRFGLGEPLASVPTVQRTHANPPPPAHPALSHPTLNSPSHPAPAASTHDHGSVDTGAPAADHAGSTSEEATSPGAPMPLLTPIQRSVAGSLPVANPLAAAPVRPALQLARLVGDAPPLATPSHRDIWNTAPRPDAPSSGGASTGSHTFADAPATRTAQLVTEARSAPPLTYGAAAPAATARPAPVGVPLSALPIATASWVNPSIQRNDSAAVTNLPPPIMVSRETAAAPQPAPIVVQTAAEPAAASAGGEHAAAGAGGAGGDAEALVARLFDPLLSRLKSELRLDRERRGSLTDLWH